VTIVITSRPSDGPTEWVDWFQNFYVLAVRRTEPLWPRVGLPGRIIGDTDGVRRTALEAFGRASEATLPENLGGNLSLWLTRFFQQVEGRYGEETAQELLGWMERNVGDQRRAWIAWDFLLPELAGQRGPDRPRIASPWETVRVKRFQAAVEAEFNDAAWNRQHIVEKAGPDRTVSGGGRASHRERTEGRPAERRGHGSFGLRCAQRLSSVLHPRDLVLGC
jgi:hypothetical protein